MEENKDIHATKDFNRHPMPGHEYMTIGRAAEILDSIKQLADAHVSSTTDRATVDGLVGMVLLGWSMEFRLRKSEWLRTADRQDTRSPNP